MNSSKVLLSFMKFKWQEQFLFAAYISLTLFANVYFDDTPFTQEEFDAAIFDLQTEGVLSQNPKLRTFGERNKALARVLLMLRYLASYVNMKANGDREIILLSGFDVNDFTNRNVKGKFNVKRGKISRQVIAKWGRDPKAGIYVVRYSIDEDGLREQYTEIKIGKVTLTINDLLKARTYLFSMAVVYSDHQGEFCDPVSLMVI